MASRSMVPGLGWDMGHTVYCHGEDHDNIHRKYLARENSTYKSHEEGRGQPFFASGAAGYEMGTSKRPDHEWSWRPSENCGCYLECDRKPRAGFKGRNHN